MAEIKGFHPKISIYTKTGWKRVSKITTEDFVASINPFTRLSCFTPVTKIYKNEYNDTLYLYKDKCINNLFVTKGSKIICYRRGDPVPFYYETKNTQTEKFLYCVRKTNGWDGDIVDIIELEYEGQKKIYKIQDFLTLLAWYYIYGKKDKFINKGILTFELSDKEFYPLFEQDMKCGGYLPFIQVFAPLPPNKNKYSINDPFFAKYVLDNVLCFNPLFLTYEKIIPDHIVQMNSFYIMKFFENISLYITKYKQDNLNYSVKFTIEDCAKRFYYLALNCGYDVEMGIKLKDTLTKVDTKKILDYRSHIRKKCLEYTVYIRSISDYMLSKCSIDSYNGNIYGIETAPYHTLLCKDSSNFYLWFADSSL